jgi:hypothetical protein
LVDGNGPDAAPGFLKGPNKGLKEHYVFDKGVNDGPSGYYHLLTRRAYMILYKRLRNEAPAFAACSCFSSQDKRDRIEAYDTNKTICSNRSVSSRPYDEIADQEAEEIARQEANRTYEWTQNEQLVVHAIIVAT